MHTCTYIINIIYKKENYFQSKNNPKNIWLSQINFVPLQKIRELWIRIVM